MALWNTRTWGVASDWVQTSGGAADDPSVVLFRAGSPDLLGGVNASGTPTWSTGTNTRPRRFFGFIQTRSLTSGEIGVLCGPNSLLWSAGYGQSAGTGYAAGLVLQNDGNLVVHSTTGTALWNSHTAGE